MSTQEPTYITDASLLTCVVPVGKGDAILRAARDIGVTGGIVHHARGAGIRERLGILGITVEAEKEVVVMMVANERRDIIIEAVYKAAEMDALAAGYIYATPVDKAAIYIPPGALQQLKDS